MDFRAIAKEVLEVEAKELLNACNNLDSKSFRDIIELIYSSDSRLIIIGVGKSGLIGAKMAATFASTGTPSFFIHPTDAMHGDLGMICKDDIALVISYSGESEEIINIMPHLKRLCKKIITMTKNKNSTISKMGDYFIDISVSKEACPLNVAPTSSTTLTLVLGDALAICLMKRRGFKEDDFALFHPGGSLGKRLFVKIKDLMQTSNIPIISKDTTMKDAIIVMTNGKLGSVLIAESNKLVGILSDGDLRRAIIRDDFSLEQKAINFATLNPKVCNDENILAYDVLRFIEDNKIQALVITDKDNSIRGLIHIHKLVEAGIK
ncbi:KpsF/GutQ family sugar-phosphate isomerase [Helicobacter sp. MIT 14-3879]|uniref:KpsF/GutQ family sugar-phosphate isomerase n=1 Tax=Helicobacter sp. MIT 14-3879 TaxID=2040649 RepID=UPI000E1F8B55|nr:KpsF/GutQ family sugar-phosphate isomerase [Helicobacter sp. MIT 14-3879]RDU65060.1 KpsF/GutQ family sugar-phosphate isomerase [Helicobacter sp. MIT 14-3879]